MPSLDNRIAAVAADRDYWREQALAAQAELLLYKNALWKACGDDESMVNEYLDSQR